MRPIMLGSSKSRTERVSSYVEPGIVEMLEDYRIKAGDSSVSSAMRRLCIKGAESVGYKFTYPKVEATAGD